MLVLDDSGALVRIVTSAAGDVDAHVSMVDHTLATELYRAKAQNTAGITTATTTTIASTPASGDTRNVKGIHIRNTHASVSNDVRVEHTDGTTAVELFKATLAPGEEMVMNDAGAWFVYDSSGGVKSGASSATETAAGLVELASVAEMEAATDATRAVTPANQHRHPGHPKAWLSCGVAADIQQSYNITSLTDTGTGVVTITIATDFAATNYCVIAQVEATATTWAVANARETHVRNATRAVGSVAIDCIDNTATTNLVKDPTSWHCVMFGDQA